MDFGNSVTLFLRPDLDLCTEGENPCFPGYLSNHDSSPSLTQGEWLLSIRWISRYHDTLLFFSTGGAVIEWNMKR